MSSVPLYIVNVEAVIYKDGKWLLAKRSEVEEHEGGSWSLIGGKVESTETPSALLEETLQREVKEEVGIEVSNLQYITSSSFVAKEPVADFIFFCTHESGQPKALDPNELTEVTWMSLEEAKNNPLVKTWTLRYLELASKLV